MSEQPKLVLASKSASRYKLLSNAGLAFTQETSTIDEGVIKTTFVAQENPSIPLSDLALILAQAKALDVSERNPHSYTIGADQILISDGKVFDKPEDSKDARDQLLALRGKEHQLETAVAIVKNGEILWSYSETSYLRLRNFTPGFLGHYLAAEGNEVTTSVGGYKLEGRGLQLFETINGDFFSILGLPMLPLLEFLRQQGLAET